MAKFGSIINIGRSSPTNVYFGMIRKQFKTAHRQIDEEEIPPPLHSPRLVFRSGASQLLVGLVMYCEIGFLTCLWPPILLINGLTIPAGGLFILPADY